ncbi:uncharacterized protein Z519_03318 [Cladophialophora bantiana CBS 173.52]|uniref:Uncharacterized protein n=1 Tax=Cladophialophora bantiana (strain ATCC 10958 / CBS 173.52 / CDC B-1940 / NIH 8579) TaxID=1442370 RepID=A0A0D2HZA9_CLAB1|nr:uncharacterized protein Z519_03318 [Cladophialophora bantiana CBS 173.52]KIW96250.1 hypothetical protein Z519_03318 [Cladophialophora bantiana CBS 173.52]
MTYWAVKRECAGTTIGVARVKQRNETNGLEAWSVNTTLSDIRVAVHIDGWNVVTGEPVFHHSWPNAFALKLNQSTELGRLDLGALGPSRFKLSENGIGLEDIGFAIRHCQEAPFQAGARHLGLKIARNGADTVVEATANLPIKGLLVQVMDHLDTTWEDNGVDPVPGQIASLRFMGKGLEVGQKHPLRARWMGGEWSRQNNVRPSL